MTAEIRLLDQKDDRKRFQSGDEALDLYFHRYTGQNQFRHHIGVTYIAARGDVIAGFVTVAPASLDAEDLPSGRKMPPYPLPVLRVASLAVDRRERGRDIGRALLRFCIELAERMRTELGCAGLVVDAKKGAARFYRSLGFEVLDVLEGRNHQVPPPLPMYLPLGSVPAK